VPRHHRPKLLVVVLMKSKSFTLALIGLSLAPTYAQDAPPVPNILVMGLIAYEKSGGSEAMAVWLNGSPLETDTTTRTTVVGGIAQIESLYGKMIGFETIHTVTVAPSMLRTYVMLKFERGPVFFAFDCYKAKSNWTIPQINFNARADTVVPAAILSGELARNGTK